MPRLQQSAFASNKGYTASIASPPPPHVSFPSSAHLADATLHLFLIPPHPSSPPHPTPTSPHALKTGGSTDRGQHGKARPRVERAAAAAARGASSGACRGRRQRQRHRSGPERYAVGRVARLAGPLHSEMGQEELQERPAAAGTRGTGGSCRAAAWEGAWCCRTAGLGRGTFGAWGCREAWGGGWAVQGWWHNIWESEEAWGGSGAV